MLAHDEDNGDAYIVWFEDAGQEPVVFTGEGATTAAHVYFNQMRSQWNCHLFLRIAKS